VALRVAGTVVGGGYGLALLREAVDLLADSQATVDRARVLLDYGVALVGHAASARDRETARDVLQDGLLLAERCGAHAVAQRAVRALRTVGGRRRPDPTSVRPTTTGTELTRSERHVAELAADHLSTSTIARTLYVSPKTVEWHLTNAYRKLGSARGGNCSPRSPTPIDRVTATTPWCLFE
jgi:DNA-binding CsgD family transcriptional regulator